MPPNDTQQITQRGQASPGQITANFQPQERPVDTFVQAGQPDATLMGLVDGLKSFNPALAQYSQLKNQEAASAAFKAGTAQGETADAGMVDAQTGGIKLPPPADSYKVDPAFSEAFSAGYRNSVGMKIGNQVQTDILSAYAENKQKDGFDPEQFLHEQVARHTAGLTDPAIIEQVSKSVAGTAESVRKDFAQVQLTRLQETAKGNLSAALDTFMKPDATPQQIHDGLINSVEPLRGQMGLMTRPELADMLLDKINNLSHAQQGRPDLFDVFTQYKDPKTGLTLQQMNPKLQSEVTRAQQQAREEQDKRIDAGMQTDYFKRTVSDEASASQGNSPDMADFAGRIGEHGQFRTASAAMSEYRRLSDLADQAKGAAQAVQMVGSGTAWALDKKTAQGALDTAQQADVGTLMQVATSQQAGDPSQLPQVQQAIKSITDITGRSGRSDLANTSLKALIDGTVNAVPPKDGQPSSQFKLAAALYGGLPDQLRSLYFDEKASSLFSSYQKDRSAGVDDNTAYATAYKSASPEAKKFAAELTSNPDWKKKVAGEVSGLTTDWYQRIPVIGRAFGGSPQNENATTTWAQMQLRDYYTRNPTASDSDAKAWVQNQVQTNFVYDPVNKVDVQVPPNQASEQTADAMKAYLEKARDKYGEDANPMLIYGKDGRYTLSAVVNGAPIHKLEDVTFDQILQQNASTKMLTPDDRSGMAALQDKLNKGTATSQDLIDNADLLAKARNLKQISDTTQGRISKLRDTAFQGALDNVFNFPMAPGSYSGLSGSRLTGQGSKMQQTAAATFLGQMNYSAALTSMGEGLVLKATPDPNPKAGNNIGYGYNLNANSGTIAEDFRRAGIPATSIEGIKAGTTQITPDQAARLLQVSLPRYEDRAKQAIEAAHPGLWTMINDRQKAALTDVAYQVGDVSQFHKAVGALARQDSQGFQDALKVTYAGKDGNRIEDTRRNNLRSLMISGPIAFLQGIKEAARTSN
jgi:hypothetical protein